MQHVGSWRLWGGGWAGWHAPDSSLEVIRGMEGYEGGGRVQGGEKVALPNRVARKGLTNNIIIDCYYYHVYLQRQITKIIKAFVGACWKNTMCLSFLGKRFSHSSNIRVPWRAC